LQKCFNFAGISAADSIEQNRHTIGYLFSIYDRDERKRKYCEGIVKILSTNTCYVPNDLNQVIRSKDEVALNWVE
jgi:hypothetical protein